MKLVKKLIIAAALMCSAMFLVACGGDVEYKVTVKDALGNTFGKDTIVEFYSGDEVVGMQICDENGVALCSLNNKFHEGDELEIVGPDLRPFTITAGNMTDLEGNPLAEPRPPQMKFHLPLPKQVPAHSIIRRSVDLSAK